METVLGVLGLIAILAVVILVFMFLLTLAMKIIYWATYSAARGVHDGWDREYPRAPQSRPRPNLSQTSPPPAKGYIPPPPYSFSESPARAQLRAAMEANRR